jgi:hypothetical protein
MFDSTVKEKRYLYISQYFDQKYQKITSIITAFGKIVYSFN